MQEGSWYSEGGFLACAVRHQSASQNNLRIHLCPSCTWQRRQVSITARLLPPQPLQAPLYAATAVAVAFFTFQNVRRWFKEARQQRQLAQAQKQQ